MRGIFMIDQPTLEQARELYHMGPATSGPGGPGAGGEVHPELQPTCAHLD